ncbi:response regulator [Sediminibacillus albus]|uniref:Two-component system, response regulator, stage 0 sporulation protein F n=1 Tax=Sediminibacillus albus TaxID=407036 RepID=A0A1G8ZKP8_9BACI|nr:response regulator [Sediminibacillus albus]SDK15646.1 two-component system, response regulator, stage 0 sporulation protein F [Sediminibacillus albus]
MAKTVMIVDDQPGIRLLLEEILKSEGYRITTAENGKEALDKIEIEQPDLLMVDYKLPIMDAKALLHKLEEKGIHIPAILMSGLSEEIEGKQDQFPMVKEIFAKPFNIEDARYRVNRILSENG